MGNTLEDSTIVEIKISSKFSKNNYKQTESNGICWQRSKKKKKKYKKNILYD